MQPKCVWEVSVYFVWQTFAALSVCKCDATVKSQDGGFIPMDWGVSVWSSAHDIIKAFLPNSQCKKMHSQITIIQVCVKYPVLVIGRTVSEISQFARLYVKLHEFKQSGFPAIPTYKETFTREALMFQNYDRANSNAFIINLVFFFHTLCWTEFYFRIFTIFGKFIWQRVHLVYKVTQPKVNLTHFTFYPRKPLFHASQWPKYFFFNLFIQDFGKTNEILIFVMSIWNFTNQVDMTVGQNDVK